MFKDAHKELSNIVEWMRVNKLSPNPQKTEFMIIGYLLNMRNLELPEKLELNGSGVAMRDKRKYLGVIINKNLDWD